jgi:hypothetical protein
MNRIVSRDNGSEPNRQSRLPGIQREELGLITMFLEEKRSYYVGKPLPFSEGILRQMSSAAGTGSPHLSSLFTETSWREGSAAAEIVNVMFLSRFLNRQASSNKGTR